MASWLILIARGVAASDQYGRITFSDQPVPGATLTVTRGDDTRTTVTDAQGVFRFADLTDGPWTLQVEMLGFSTLRQEVVFSPNAQPLVLALTLLPFDTIVASGARRPEPTSVPAAAASALPARPGGFQRANVNVPAAAGDTAVVAGSGSDGDRSNDAAEGFLINGSVNNGAASPFAQLAAFGNNRRNSRSLYNGGLGVLLGTSAWAAAPYSFTDRPSPKPSYNDTQIVGSRSPAR